MNNNSVETFAERSIASLLFFTFTAALGGFLFGFDTAVISGTIDSLREQFELSSVLEGWVVSSALLGCIIGAISVGVISDKFGRKKVLIASAALFFISAVGSTIPQTVTFLIFARLIGGLGVGMASMLSPLYISEFSPPDLRGRLVALYQFAIVIGILVAYFSNSMIVAFSSAHTEAVSAGFVNWVFVDEYWRGMFFTESLPALLFMVFMIFVPESPRWLAKQGKTKDAVYYLSKTVGKDEAEREIGELDKLLAYEKGSITELFKPSLRIPLLIGILLPFFSQFTGINVIIYYGTSIFKDAGLGVTSAFGAQVLVGLINAVFTTIAIWKVDKFGRKPLLQAGAMGLSLILLLLGMIYSRDGGNSFIIPVLFCLHVGFFAMSFGPVTWIIISEIFPTKIRGRAVAIGTFIIWVSCAIVAQTFPWLRDNFSTNATFYIYACAILPSVFVVWFMVPETKQKTLEQIEESWQKDYDKKQGINS